MGVAYDNNKRVAFTMRVRNDSLRQISKGSPMKKYIVASTIVLISQGALISPVRADQEQRKGITVAGECLKKVTRDRAAVTVSSSVVALSARESSKKATETHESLKRDVKDLLLNDLTVSTSGYSVSQECSWSTSERKCSGYRTTISTRYETPHFTDLENIIGIATKYGAEDVAHLETFASPSLLKSERESCLEIATRNAQAKAEKIASGAGVQLGPVISITENSHSSPPIYHGFAADRAVAMDAKAAVAPSIDAAPLDLEVAVSAVYGIQ
jgi:uncharacterized protein YggE